MAIACCVDPDIVSPGGGFQVTQIASLVADYQAGEHVYTDVEGLTLAGPNDPVALWKPANAPGSHQASQATLAKRPVVRVGSFGSQPALEFSADDLLACNTLGTLFSGDDLPFSIVLVVRFRVNKDQDVFGLGVGTGISPLHTVRTSATGHVQSRTDNAAANSSHITGTSPDLLSHVWTLTFSGTVSNQWRDATQIGAANQPMDRGTCTFTRGTIGGRQGDTIDSTCSEMFLARLLVFSAALSTADRTNLQTYLKNIYGTP